MLSQKTMLFSLLFLLGSVNGSFCMNGQTRWSGWFSEESGWEDHLKPITKIQCRGHYCDDMRFEYRDNCGFTGDVEYTEFHSEESAPFHCPSGTFVSGLKCQGHYCDDIKFVCRKPRLFKLNTNDFRWTSSYFSEEADWGNSQSCPSGYVLTGMECNSHYCDNKKLGCTKAEEDVDWSSWSSWGECSTSCKQERSRSCSGSGCDVSEETEEQDCYDICTPGCVCQNGTPDIYWPSCPRRGAPRCSQCNKGHTLKTEGEAETCVLTEWSDWGQCSLDCVNRDRGLEYTWVKDRDTSPGVQYRTRGCGDTNSCEGDIVSDPRDCDPAPEQCVHECVNEWCNNRGSALSDSNDLDGCDCECDLGWSNAAGTSPYDIQCTEASFCFDNCYLITTEEECNVTGMYSEAGKECPQCYWHDNVLGCLHKGEYVIGWDINLDYDPSDIDVADVQAKTYRYVYTYSNLNVYDMTITDKGHDREITETISYKEEMTTLDRDGRTSTWEDFKRQVNENMQRETQSQSELDAWSHEKQKRQMRSHTLELKACVSSTATKGVSDVSSVEVSAEFCATNTNTEENEDTETIQNSGSLEFDSESIGEQTDSWETSLNDMREDWSSGEKSDLEMEESRTTKTYRQDCTVDDFTIPALSAYQVTIVYSEANYDVYANAQATITTTRSNSDQMGRDQMGRNFIVDIGTVLSMETQSECYVDTRHSGFITELYDCDAVQNAVMVANLLDTNTFLPRCMTPSYLYEPTQWCHKSKWCSTSRGVKEANSNELFDVVGHNGDMQIYDDPDNYPKDCSNNLRSTKMCEATELDFGTTTPDSSTIQVTLRGYASTDLLEAYPECKHAFTGLQELVKVVIPPRTQIWLKVHSDEVDATLIARFGDLCPGKTEPTESFDDVYVANNNKQCNPSVALSNGDLNDEVTAYVVIASNALEYMAGSTIVEIEYKTAPYHSQESADCRRSLDWWISNTPREDVAQWGCEYYGVGDNQLECSFDGINTVHGWITAADVCPSCGCIDWRAECMDVTEDWACNCNRDVEDCDGVCGGSGSICAEECDWDYGIPGMANVEKQTSGRRRTIFKGGAADIDEYPWFVQLGHLGSAHYVGAVPIATAFSNVMTGTQSGLNELEDAFISHCGGTFIGRSTIITAAHCTMKFKWVEGDDIDKADIDNAEERRITHVALRHGTVIVPIKRILYHKQFNRLQGKRPLNDIAIVEIEPVPCDMRIQPIEIADDFDFDGCTAFAEGSGEEFLRYRFSPSVSPVPMPEEVVEPDCTCENLYEADNLEPIDDRDEAYYYDAYNDDNDYPSVGEPQDAATKAYDYDAYNDDNDYPSDGEPQDAATTACEDFTQEDRKWCTKNGIAQYTRKIWLNGRLTHDKYPDVGNFKEMITKAWSAQSCNMHDEIMYPMKDAHLLEETFCAWTGDFEQHILHPETACNGDSGSGLKIDMDLNADSHYYALLGVVSYGKAGGCAADSTTVFVHLAKYKEWILKAFPGAPFVPPAECDRRDYYEGSSIDDATALASTYNGRLHSIGYQDAVSAFKQKYLEETCPFPLNSQETLLVKGWPGEQESRPFTVRTALNFGNGVNSMNSRPLTTSEQEWLLPYFNKRRPYGCLPYSNSALGKIAIVRRGRCAFHLKFKHAMDANALALVVIDPGYDNGQLTGMQNGANSGFDNVAEYGPAMFMGEEGTDIWRALRANAELSFQMKCADFKHDSEWIPDEAASFTQLHSVDFCESSPPKKCGEEKLCAPLCKEENECAMRLDDCCDFDCAPWTYGEDSG